MITTATGYTYVIYYQSEGDSGNVSISSGETHTYLLTGLQSGVVYSISIVAVIHIPSPVVGPVNAGMYTITTYITDFYHFPPYTSSD